MEAKWRKMRKGVLGGCVGIVVIACVTGGCFGGESAMAIVSQISCSGIGQVYNPSLKTACEDYRWNPLISHGALWLSNTGQTDLSSKVTTDGVNGNKVNVFLRGTIIGGTTGKSNNAECIELSVKRGNVVYKPFDLSGDVNLDTSAPSCDITQAGGKTKKIEKNYYVVRNENGTPFKNNIIFSEMKVGLDVSKISQWGGDATRDGGRIDYKDVPVDVYRCFGDNRDELDPRYPYCGSSESMVTIGGDLMSVESSVSSGNKKISTGEVVNWSVTRGPLVLDGCKTGCNVTFRHEIKVKSGYKFGQRFYRKISNYINRQVADPELTSGVGERMFEFESNDKVYNKTVKLYPGEIYCSKIDYGIGTSLSDHGVIRNAGVCAMVRGTLNTDISLNVEGEKGAPLHIVGNRYYVAPNRKYYVGGSYVSNTQKAYGLRINEGVIGDKRFSPDPSASISDWWKLMGTRTKTLGERMSWSNTVLLRDGGDGGDFSFAVGSRCGQGVSRYSFGEDWKCNVKKGEPYSFQLAGVQKTVTIATEVSSSGAAVPSSIVFKSSSNVKNNSFLMAEIRTDRVSDALNLLVPYNFTNSTWVEGGGMKNIDLESGFDVTYHVKVGDRENKTLGANTTSGATYATQVDNATSGVYWCKAKKDKMDDIKPDDVCEGGNYVTKIHRDKDGHEQETLFPNSDNNPRSVEIGWEELTEQEVEVGDIICAWSWVTPGGSGNGKLYDTRMDSDWGINNIANSWDNGNSENNKVCGQIGKSPTIQVWGGNVLSKGELNVSKVKEKTLKEKTRRFGSFGELGVFAGDSGNFANGAALGYGGIRWKEGGKDVLLPSYLGQKEGDSEEIGGGSEKSMGDLKFDFGGDGGIEKFANALGGKYCGDEPSGCPNSVEAIVDNCKNGGSCSEDVDNNTIIINSGMNVIVNRDGDVVISTNVQYGNSGYSSFSEVPRFIVIANDIEIGCDVTRIDGLLVATGTVNTCNKQEGDLNDADYSHQLIVNGAIIAKELVANRTYGAGPGIYSIVPAEIVRFDPTLLDLDLGSNDSNPKIVNITELPPRY